MNVHTSAGPRRRTRRALLATALAMLALPAAAQASIVEERPDGKLKFREDGAEINNVTVIDNDTSATRVQVDVRDLGGIDSRTPLCAAVSAIRVRCALGIQLGEVRLGALNDNVAVAVSNEVVVFGGPGGDGYTGATGPEGSRVVFHGEDGFDTVSYPNADRGVRIVNDNVLRSGRIARDLDAITSTVERFEGSRFDDEITDLSAGGLPKTVVGGQGNDVLNGARFAGSVTTFEMGPAADGADEVFARDGFAIVDYSRRRQPVNVTASLNGADDGEAGERDHISVRDALINGGQAGDVLRASEFSTEFMGFDGGPGNDRIEGGAVTDNLTGGTGVDTLVANGGDDHIFAQDGSSDIIGCGAGADNAHVDSTDLTSGCESRFVGALELSRRALQAEAGGTAALRLSWRHPVSWRKLRQIELRLTRGGAPVGEVTIRPRGERITAAGAVELVRERTRLTRNGKLVTARLALRLDESLAGETLKADVEATDMRGRRQLERDAGTIRVAR